MAIYERVGKDGRTAHWQVVIDVDDGSGRRKRRVIGTFPTKKAAEVAHRTALTARDEGALLDKNGMTVRELLSRWLADKATTVSANTLTDYRIVAERHIAPSPLGAMQVRRVAPADIQQQYSTWLAAGASAHLVREYHMRLNQAFGFAVRMKLVAHNPVRDATPPRVAVTTFDHWTADEAKQFLEAAQDDPRFAMWCVLLREGTRRAEALGLRWGDIDFEAETMRISQTVIYNKQGAAPCCNGRPRRGAAIAPCG